MNCYNHPGTPAAAYCRACGRPLCLLCQRTSDGVIYCAEHAPLGATVPAATVVPPAASGPTAGMGSAGAWSGTTAPPPPPPRPAFSGEAANPYVAAPVPPAVVNAAVSPGLAFLLGLIPGVGAIYNGQYVKGLVHAAIFGLLITVAQNTGPNAMTALFVMAFYCYMPFEAYHTARKRQLGLPVEEWSSLMGQKAPASQIPVGPIVLILVGVLFLLNSLDLLDIHAVVRFWPVLLIVCGIALLVVRLRSPRVGHQNASGEFGASPVSETARER